MELKKSNLHCKYELIHFNNVWLTSTLQCSNCAIEYQDNFNVSIEDWKYCPNCGAKIKFNYLSIIKDRYKK